MGSLFRSEEMTLAQLFLQSESAYACVRELGEIGKVQFRDLNPDVSAFQRKFTNEVRRCDEMERKLRFLVNELEKVGIEPCPGDTAVEAPNPQDMIDLEGKFEVLEAEVKEINTNKETLKRNLLDLIELHHILCKTQTFFMEAEQYAIGGTMGIGGPLVPTKGVGINGDDTTTDDDREEKGFVDQERAGSAHTKFTFVTGVIVREKLAVFERILWRACRGNVFLRMAEIEEPLENPTTGLMENKVVFILFFQGDQLRTRVRKICEGFHATLYQCPETAQEREEMTIAVTSRINDLQSVLRTTEDHSLTQLNDIAQEIDTWQIKVKKIKAIYHILNLFNLDVTQRCLIAECWCPVDELEEIQRALNRGTERSGSTVPSILNRMTTKEKPPTYHKVNKFTRGFQTIVDAYGVATYQEVNPTPYTIITFPFLFAVMFGDAGHGFIMATFALLLIIFEKKLQGTKTGGEMFSTIFSGRYIIFLMGLFSIYTGLIYNDIFAKSFNIFGSSWNTAFSSIEASNGSSTIGECCPEGENCVTIGNSDAQLTVFPREAFKNLTPYPFGLDPIWSVAENKLLYTNSYKMKMAVILGIGQMLFGVILSIFNHIHFKKYINIFVEFIPQILFLLSIFGWLVFLIFYKWCYHYENPNYGPSLLITLIGMFLEFGSAPHVDPENPETNEYSVFGPSPADANAQRYIHMLLVIVAVICIPWMLCIKPFYLLSKHKREQRRPGGYRRAGSYNVTPDGDPDDNDEAKQVVHHEADKKHLDQDPDDVGGEIGGEMGGEEEEFEFSEVFIHQAIHTIEYCLGTISNTASYLRLWALSLAHAELSEVLWQQILQLGIGIGTSNPSLGVILVFCLFAFWAVLTIGILLIMEGLSAFLHALRLHWVEFQNKFYDGDGYKFMPFLFETVLKGEDEI